MRARCAKRARACRATARRTSGAHRAPASGWRADALAASQSAAARRVRLDAGPDSRAIRDRKTDHDETTTADGPALCSGALDDDGGLRARRMRSDRQRVRLQRGVYALPRLRRHDVRRRRVPLALRHQGQRVGGGPKRGEPMRGLPQRYVLRRERLSVRRAVQRDRPVALAATIPSNGAHVERAERSSA